MQFNARVYIEDGELLCCSQSCEADGGCDYINTCKKVKIQITEDNQDDKIHS